VNRGMLDYTGLSVEEVQAERFARVYSSRRHPKTSWMNVKRPCRDRTFENEQRLWGKTGVSLVSDPPYHPLLDENGKVIRWLCDRERTLRIASRQKIACETKRRLEKTSYALPCSRSSVSSEALRQVMAQVSKVAPTDPTVLILGETGPEKN